MSRFRAVALIAALALLAGVLPAAAQTTASVRGTVTDPGGGVMPGVSVIASSDALVAGRQVAITNENGVYRFPSLPPGEYTLRAELQGFQPAQREATLLLGSNLNIDLQLGDPEFVEEIVVVAEASQVSTVSNTVSHNVTQDFINRQPVSRSPTDLINFAPGVVDGQAYGAPSDYQNAYNLDGVDVSDPALGSQWILPSMDWVQEVQVVGLGADAEYGGFTGAVVNLITKSGGNEFTGDIRAYYSDDSLNSENAPPGVEGQNVVTEDWDVSFSLGGPIVRDKVWFFVSGNEREEAIDPFYTAGAPLDDRSDSARSWSRYMGKITWQVDESNRVFGLVDYDAVEEDYRGIGDLTLASATEIQDSPSFSYNLSWESLINDSNFITAKLTGFEGEDDRLPHNGMALPGRYDLDTGFAWQNLDEALESDKDRLSFDVSWSLFADGLIVDDDSHNFKVGVTYEDLESVEVTTRPGGYTIVDDTYFGGEDGFGCATLDEYFNDPTCALFSSDRGGTLNINAEMEGLHAYVQDSWKIDRVTLNYGVRYSQYTGGFTNADSGDVYDVDMIAPRLGAVWDVLGDGTTAVKLHYGQYHEGMAVVFYDREASGNAFPELEFWDYNFDTGMFDIDAGGRKQGEAIIADGIDHPYIEQYVASFERQVHPTMIVGVDYVHREAKDIIAMVTSNVGDYDALIAPDSPITGEPLPFFELLSEPEFLITNPEDAERDYDSVILRTDRRYSDGWSLQASLTWTDITGNTDYALPGYVDDYEDLNGLVNASGTLPFFSEWVLKVSGSVDLPWDIVASAFYQFRTGEYWTPYVRIRGLLENDRTTVFLTERGSEQLPDRDVLDVHLEKGFSLGGGLELAVVVDVFNLLDSDEVTSVAQRWGDYDYDWTDHPGNSEFLSSSSYKTPISIQTPRRVRLGARFTF